MNLPNIYGAGAGFGFSGFDGLSTSTDDFAGFFTGDRIGVAFELASRHTLAFELDKTVHGVRYSLVVNDALDAELTAMGDTGFMRFVMAEHRILVGCARLAKPVVIAETSCAQFEKDDCLITEETGSVTALYTEIDNNVLRFAFGFDKTADGAVSLAKRGIFYNVDEIMKKRIAFYHSLPVCPLKDSLIEKAYYKAFSILKHNMRTEDGLNKLAWTTPDRLPHRYMWLWDSAFHTFGLRYISEELAARAVEAVLDRQHEDGFIPHMMTPAWSSAITQPPIFAWAVESCFARTGDRELIKRSLPKLRAYLEWNLKNRDSNKNLLCEWLIEGYINCRSGESGMDNSPRFDAAACMDAVDFSCYMKNEYDCLSRMESALGLETQAKESAGLAERIADAINLFLWNETLGMYTDRLMDGSLSNVMAVSGFMPLWAGVATPGRAEKLIAHIINPKTFGTPLPVPSVAANDPEYCTDMWRGSVWMNYNYMIVLGLKRYGSEMLANELAKKSVDAMSRWYGHCGSLYEFYHAEDKYPPQTLDRKGPVTQPIDIRRASVNVADYGWTAAVYVALLLEGFYKA